MLNLVRLLDRAVSSGRSKCDPAPRPTRPMAATADRSSIRLGGKIVWQGSFELMLIGPTDERWDHCFIAEYPSVAAFVETIRDPVYREVVKHRQAAVKDLRLIRLKPLASGNTFGEIPQ